MFTNQILAGIKLPYLLLFVLLAILLLLAVIFLVFRSARKKPAEVPKSEDAAQTDQAEEPRPATDPKLTRSFDSATGFLKKITSRQSYRYDLPWIMMLGPSGSGKTTVLEKSGLIEPFRRTSESAAHLSGNCHWRPFENGVVLDINGNLVLGEDGRTSDEKSWAALLRQLQKHRPQRPIDGVVLTINCRDLLEDTPDQAAAKADRLYKKLWHAQKELGLRFPVYVLVTQCDRIEGFQSFCREIPRSFKNNIFGWSSPYSGETAYSSEWVNEAFAEVNQTLIRYKYDLFAQGPESRDQDDLFLFTTHFAQLTGPVKTYLDGLFKQSVYHELFIMRGLYFCGDSGLDAAPQPFFVRDLLERKVFPESPLARPLTAIRISRNRVVRVMQVVAVLLAVIAALSLWRAGRVINTAKVPIVNVLREIQTDLEYLHANRTDGQAYNSSGHFPKSTYDLLNGMSEIRTSQLRTIFVPAYYYGSLRGNIRDCMCRAYRDIIMLTVRTDLIEKARQLIEGPVNPVVSSSLALFSKDRYADEQKSASAIIEETPAYIKLHDYVHNLSELGINIELFNKLTQSGQNDLTALARIIDYLYGLKLPGNFYTQTGYYQDILSRITMDPIFIERYRPDATAEARVLIYQLYQVTFHENPLLNSLHELAAQLASLGQVQGCQADDCLVWGLLENIQRVEKALSSAHLARLFKDPPQLWDSFKDIIETMRNSEFFGPTIAREAEEIAQEQLVYLRNEWLHIKDISAGQLLQGSPSDQKILLSSQINAIKAGLIDLWQQDFTGSDLIEAPPIIIPPSARFRWNPNLLQEASALLLSYDKYRSGGYGKFPPQLRNSMDKVARDCLEKTVLKFVARAADSVSQQYGYNDRIPEPEALDEARNFQNASKELSFLLESFDRLHMTTGHNVLSDLVYWQASSLLGILDGILESGALYEPDTSDIDRWETQANLALAAFNVTDKKELDYYLSLQRQRVAYLAGYAEPMVNFYNERKMIQTTQDGTLFFKWGQIQTDLKEYQTNKPENTVTVLEKFIRFQVSKTTLQNFYQMISQADLQAYSSDFFLEKRNDIRRALYRQCRYIVSGKLNDKYETIRIFFNNCLSGRFPFSGGNVDLGIGSNPEDIKQFYRYYDMYANDIRNVLTPESRNAAVDFLDRMGKVRPVFASFLDPPPEKKKPGQDKKDDKEGVKAPAAGQAGAPKKKPDKPVLNFALQFRVNRAMEENANKIMEWTLDVGNYQYIDDGSVYDGIWNYADPVALHLRFAKDSGFRPDPESAHGPVQVSGKTITYQFPDQWALINFIRNHAADPRDFVKHVDPKPYTLKFCIDTLSEGTASGEPVKLQTKAFIRLTPMDDSKAPIALPCFPVIAPPWNEGDRKMETKKRYYRSCLE